MTARDILDKVLNKNLVEIVLSNPRVKSGATKVKIRPVMIKDRLMFQETTYIGTQVFHENRLADEMKVKIIEAMEGQFKQCQIMANDGNGTILSGKDGHMTVKFKASDKAVKEQKSLEHNRAKKYLLEEGVVVPFLQDLGVMNKDGKIINAKYDKFKQINRFLEFVEDILPQLEKGKEQTIIDFGCGKSYLKFAMYDYLKVLKGYDVRIIGLDLKKDVIEKCSYLAKKYGYDKLEFSVGDIASYTKVNAVDMVVTLHACDVATDYALAKAVNWGAKVILSVPCCQHEANKTIDNAMLEPVFKHGILKERMAAIVTDSVRAGILEAHGYKTQILEFIDMEHTPKNLLIRAVKSGKPDVDKYKEIIDMEKQMQLSLTLGKLIPVKK